MSKFKISTKDKIRDKALEMFNERGIEYVGLRELAGLLDMRVSNITYYFPTKDDLVNQLAQDLATRNNSIIVSRDNLTLLSFFEMLQQVFKNHVEFRCLLLSVVHVLKQNKQMAAAYKKTQASRSNALNDNITVLVSSGYLNLSEEDQNYIVSSISLISRFWISEASVSYRQWSIEKQIAHYLVMITKILAPHATAKGKKDIQNFVSRFSG